MILRARLVVPVAGPAIENGAVVIDGERIRAVGPWNRLAGEVTGEVTDLGEVILLPGLINAHCHLDYTGMAGQIPAQRRFTDWIKAIVALKAHWSYADFAQSWLLGTRMLQESGTTTVVDVEAVPELIPDLWHATPLRVLSFRELICLKSRVHAEQQVAEAVSACAAIPQAAGRVGLSPHAPYTTSPELLRHAAAAAARQGWLLTTHVAESEDEFDMFMYRHGPLFDWLKSQRDMADCGAGSPIRHLDRCGYLASNLLAVHVNYLWRDDAAVLGRRGVSVVHCPRSHAYFRHLFFPHEELADAGVNICLGTDSLASTLKPANAPLRLSLFDEMTALAATLPDLTPATILRMATLNPARALRRVGELGELSPGAWADLIAVPYGGPLADAMEALIHHSGPVAASVINGHWALPPRHP